jgi:spore coat protein A, manganese oxidase
MKPNNQSPATKAHSRRDFLKVSTIAGAGFLVPWVSRANHESTLKYLPRLNGASVPKYVDPLPIPRVMTPTVSTPAYDYYEVAIQQFPQQILPSGGAYPPTLVAGYGPINGSAPFSTPGPLIVADATKAVRVRWINGQVDAAGNFLPHILGSEMFPDHVMWANPPGPRDSHGWQFVHNPYLGPVPIVTHLHGGASKQESDGHPLAWYLPNANNLPAGFYDRGTLYDDFKSLAAGDGLGWQNGDAVFEYSGNDIATLLWCHDHTMGLTEYNVYAGFAGGFLVKGGAYDLPDGVLPKDQHEIPLVIQDRAFGPNGALLFHGAEEGGYGDTIMVNGCTWPYLNVARCRYRFRVLNGCNNVPLKLYLSRDDVPVHIIGGDIGFLPQAARVRSLPLTNAERADLIVDFTSVPTGTVLYLLNEGEGPFAKSIRQVMKFIVGAKPAADPSTPASQLGLLPVKPLPVNAVGIRQLALFDHKQGTLAAGPLEFEDPPTETPAAGSTEIWEFYSDDSHPMHLHAAKFEVLNRQRYGGSVRGPKAWERGWKDTVDVQENGVTRVRVHFDDHPGLFVWHCHLLRHEDLGMMRPLELQP